MYFCAIEIPVPCVEGHWHFATTYECYKHDIQIVIAYKMPVKIYESHILVRKGGDYDGGDYDDNDDDDGGDGGGDNDGGGGGNDDGDDDAFSMQRPLLSEDQPQFFKIIISTLDNEILLSFTLYIRYNLISVLSVDRQSSVRSFLFFSNSSFFRSVKHIFKTI